MKLTYVNHKVQANKVPMPTPKEWEGVYTYEQA
jgi:hypothetical protein